MKPIALLCVPIVDVEGTAGVLRIEVTDEHSTVGRLEVRRDGEVQFLARPDDGVCDAPRERFELDLEGSDLRSGSWELRAVDAAGNSATVAVPQS